MQIMNHVTPIAPLDGSLLGASPDAAAARPAYALNADTAYPAAIAHIQAVLDGQGYAPSLRMYVDKAKEIGPAAWDLAQRAYSAFNPTDPADIALLAERRAALEVVRGWAVELLHLAVGYAPMDVKITGSKDWKHG